MIVTITLDTRQIDRLRQSCAAARETLMDTGRAMLYAGMRRKLPWEAKRPAHSFMILNVEKKRHGRDPVTPSPAEEARIRDRLATTAQKAVDAAARTGKEQSEKIRRVLGRGKAPGNVAEWMRLMAFRRITLRQTGYQNTARRTAKKRALAVVGAIRQRGRETVQMRRTYSTSKYGLPPPYLVDTGRLVESLSGVWNLGYSTSRRL